MAGRRAVKKESLPEMIASDLRQRVLSGELAEGEAIRQELLAQEYDVSRMPVREALKRLAAEGLLQWENNRGGSVVRHSLPEIAEIFDLRILIEVDLLRRAIPMMTNRDFDSCERLLSRMDEAYETEDVSTWGEYNSAYHMALYAAADRRMSMEFLERLHLHSDRYVRIHLSVMEQREPAKEEHRELLEFARQGDASGGATLLTRHIARAKSELLAMIERQRLQSGD